MLGLWASLAAEGVSADLTVHLTWDRPEDSTIFVGLGASLWNSVQLAKSVVGGLDECLEAKTAMNSLHPLGGLKLDTCRRPDTHRVRMAMHTNTHDLITILEGALHKQGSKGQSRHRWEAEEGRSISRWEQQCQAHSEAGHWGPR